VLLATDGSEEASLAIHAAVEILNKTASELTTHAELLRRAESGAKP
jgi:hypothetical protein